MEMRAGSPSIVRLSCPQLQAARRVVMDMGLGLGSLWIGVTPL
jgi:hypothetical protein